MLFLSRRPQYKPLSLKRLQYLIDLGRVDPTQPIDLTQLVNARGLTIQPLKRDYGVQLVDEVTVAVDCDPTQTWRIHVLPFMFNFKRRNGFPHLISTENILNCDISNVISKFSWTKENHTGKCNVSQFIHIFYFYFL